MRRIPPIMIQFASTSAFSTSTPTIFRGLIKPSVTMRTAGAIQDFSHDSALSKSTSRAARSKFLALKMALQSKKSISPPDSMTTTNANQRPQSSSTLTLA